MSQNNKPVWVIQLATGPSDIWSTSMGPNTWWKSFCRFEL